LYRATHIEGPGKHPQPVTKHRHTGKICTAGLKSEITFTEIARRAEAALHTQVSSIQIKACGQGIKLKDFPDVQVMSLDPELLRKMGIVIQGNRLVVPVTHVIPASIMGSGTGSRHSFSGDFDIQVADQDLTQKHGLQSLCLRAEQ